METFINTFIWAVQSLNPGNPAWTLKIKILNFLENYKLIECTKT